MIEWEDVYRVIVAIVPLYVALVLGYGSVRWWGMFNTDQCDAINRMVCYLTYPMFVLDFTAHMDPYQMNTAFIAADAVSKLIIAAVLGCFHRCMMDEEGDWSSWFITGFSLSTLTNSLVVGVPLVKAMYGPMAVDLVVQSSVFQALVWLTLLLFVLELRRTRMNEECRMNYQSLMKQVCVKLAKNPNSYACVVGITWALLSHRCHVEMPRIIEGSIEIMSRAGTGTAMFSMGLFMATQEKFIACGPSLAVLGIILKFILGPVAMAVASFSFGLHGDILRVSIIQAALPQSITSFIFAKEYGLHADILSTAVIFGMFVSIPLLIGYHATLEFIH